MILSIFDGSIEAARFIVDIGVNKFAILPEIMDSNFSDMKDYIRYIIGRYLSRYLMRDGDFTDSEIYKIESEIIEEIRSIVMREISYYNNCENKSYYNNLFLA